MNTARRSLTGIPRSALTSLGLGLLGALSGCFNPTPPANVLCAPDAWCPSGQTCDTSRWQCVPDGQIPDAGGFPWFDSSPWPPPPDSYYPPWQDAGSGEGIAAVLAAPSGDVSIHVKEVLITYIKPAVDSEPPGFFVQGDPYGPALLVTVNPSFPGVRLAVGDRVSFRVYYTDTFAGNRVAELIDELVVHSRGNDVSALVQDVNSAYDLGTNVAAYSGELISADLFVAGSAYEDGYGFVKAPVGTSSVFDGLLAVRVSPALQELIGLEEGCYFRLYAVPVWRYWDSPFFPVHDLSELGAITCPLPRVEAIEADTDTTVRLELSRALDASSLQADGSQFTIPGLTVTAAAVDGRVLTLTTTPQTAGELYIVTVAPSVLDILQTSFFPNSFSFVGAAARARVRINEVKANIVPSCDLLELRVTQGGSLEGVRVTEQGATTHTFGPLMVATDDLIVLHFNSFSTQCNPGRSPSETQAANERPRVVYGANFDTAYDIHVAPVGLDVAPQTIAVFDHRDRMLDIVLVTTTLNLPDGSSEQEAALAAEAGEWRAQDGSVPPGGFRGATFRDHAAAGLEVDQVTVVNGWSALDGKASVQRSSNADENHSGDWTTAPHTFGVLNPGQSPF